MRAELSLCAVLVAGCGGTTLAGGRGPGKALGYLPAAEGETSGPDDFEEVEPAPKVTPPKKPAPAAPPARVRRFGVRLGCLAFLGASEREIDPALLLGGSYALPLGKESPLSLELGLDAAPVVSAASGDYDSTLVFARAAARWVFGERRGIAACVTGGVSGLFETTDGEALASAAQNSAMLIDLGAGIVDGRGRWEGRLSYSVPVGSENVGGFLQVSAGVGF